MSRVNKGKHIIISDEVHTKLKSMCTRTGVRMTDVADTVLVDFIRLIESASFPSEQDTILRTAAARRERLVEVKDVPTSEPKPATPPEDAFKTEAKDPLPGELGDVTSKDEAPANGTSIPQ